MVGERDVSVPAEVILDSPGFEQPRVMRREGWRPPGAGEIERRAVNRSIASLTLVQCHAQRAEAAREPVDKIQPLPGMQRVPVERHCGSETAAREGIRFKVKVG